VQRKPGIQSDSKNRGKPGENRDGENRENRDTENRDRFIFPKTGTAKTGTDLFSENRDMRKPGQIYFPD
jgi:hypothetical protein